MFLLLGIFLYSLTLFAKYNTSTSSDFHWNLVDGMFHQLIRTLLSTYVAKEKRDLHNLNPSSGPQLFMLFEILPTTPTTISIIVTFMFIVIIIIILVLASFSYQC